MLLSYIIKVWYANCLLDQQQFVWEFKWGRASWEMGGSNWPAATRDPASAYISYAEPLVQHNVEKVYITRGNVIECDLFSDRRIIAS